MFNLRLIGLVSTGAWPASWVGDVAGQDFAGDGGCGTLSISEHCLNLGERRCVAGFQKLAMSTGVTRWWKISVISCFTMLYIWKYHTLLSLQLCPPTTMVFPILEMSLHRHSRRPTPTSPRRFTTCGWWGIRWKPFSSLQSSRGPGEKGAWHGRWFIDGLLNIDGLLMVYSWFILYWWFVDVYIYIYWWFMIDVFWCFLMFVVYSQRRSDCWVSISGKPQRKPGTPEPAVGLQSWVNIHMKGNGHQSILVGGLEHLLFSLIYG